jgi:hypothetical protein
LLPHVFLCARKWLKTDLTIIKLNLPKSTDNPSYRK